MQAGTIPPRWTQETDEASMLRDMERRKAHLDALDPVIHQPTRLRVLSALVQSEGALTFQTLAEQARLKRSNLSMQLGLLERAGLVDIQKARQGRSAVTRVVLTPVGLNALADYCGHLLAALQEEASDG